MIFIFDGEFPDLNTTINRTKSHWSGYSSTKAIVTDRVAWLAKSYNQSFKGAVDIKFKWFLRNRKKDPDNITFAKKYILDGLVKAGVLENDSFKFINSFSDTWEVANTKPRVEVEITSSK